MKKARVSKRPPRADLNRMFPFTLALIGTVFTLAMLLVLVGGAPWHPLWHTVMLACIAAAAAATGGLLVARPWARTGAALVLILSGLGAFFAFMLAHADDPLTLGTQYPLMLFAVAFLCVTGVWVMVEDVSDEEQAAPPR